MSKSSKSPDPTNEERYMALLALTSQTLPAKPGEGAGDTSSHGADPHDALFRRLDADTTALEDYLSRERGRDARRKRTIRDELERWLQWFTVAPSRWITVAALGALVLLSLPIINVSLQDTLQETVAQSFSDLRLPEARSATQLMLPWERNTPSLGFTPPNVSGSSQQFARGMLHGRQLLNAPNLDRAKSADDSAFAALGEWNILLWTACESPGAQTQHFWRTQLKLRDRFAAADALASDPIVAGHLNRVDALLQSIVDGVETRRTARELSDELLGFREAFAPRELVIN